MSRKGKGNKYFRVGKNVPKNDSMLKPMKGEPNSNLDTYHKESGKFYSRRKYGKDGYAVKDMDVAEKTKPYDHVHDISYNDRPHEDRKPTKQEQREMDKAKKKRRFWKW